MLYTGKLLVSFGNYLLSTKQPGTEVTHADIVNWHNDNDLEYNPSYTGEEFDLPCNHQRTDDVFVDFGGAKVKGTITKVSFPTSDKVEYDVVIIVNGGKHRIHGIPGILITKQ